MALVDAKWSGPWGFKLPDGTDLVPGETIRQVPEFQAKDDPYWTPLVPIVETKTVVKNDTSKGGDTS